MKQFEIMDPLEIHHLLRAAQHHHRVHQGTRRRRSRRRRRKSPSRTRSRAVTSSCRRGQRPQDSRRGVGHCGKQRQAMVSASDRPERARPWIFGVESDDTMMDDVACADEDRHRTLDAKLAETLAKILKGEPARKMALAAERTALSQDLLRGRQCLLLICAPTRSSGAPRRSRTRRPTRTSRTSAAVQATAHWNPSSRCGRNSC